MQGLTTLCLLAICLNVFHTNYCSSNNRNDDDNDIKNACGLIQKGEEHVEADRGSQVSLTFNFSEKCFPTQGSLLTAVSVRNVSKTSKMKVVYCQFVHNEQGSCYYSQSSDDCYCNNKTGEYRVRIRVQEVGQEEYQLSAIFNQDGRLEEKVLGAIIIDVVEKYSSEVTTEEVTNRTSTPSADEAEELPASVVSIIVIILVVTTACIVGCFVFRWRRRGRVNANSGPRARRERVGLERVDRVARSRQQQQQQQQRDSSQNDNQSYDPLDPTYDVVKDRYTTALVAGGSPRKVEAQGKQETSDAAPYELYGYEDDNNIYEN